jgi:type I restriction enzyme S subunit
MSEWVTRPLSALADIRVSNVDKKSLRGEKPVLLCNYMDAYANDYIRSDIAFMQATATAAEIAKFKVDAGDVIITKDSETPDDIGIPAVVTDRIDNLVCGYHLALLKTRQELVDPVFLCKQLGSHEAARYFGQRAAGSTRYGLSNGALASFPVSLPALPKQKRIASVLSGIDTAIEKTAALIDKYQQIKAGLMHDLFTRGVLPNGQLRPPRDQAPELYQETAIGSIPREWDCERLGPILLKSGGYLQTGPFGSQLHADEYQNEGVPVVMPQDINDGLIGTTSIARISPARAKSLSRHSLKVGDIIIARRGELSRAAAIGNEEVNWLCGTGCFLLRLGKTELNHFFFSHVYRHDLIQRQIAGMQVGTTMPSLNNNVMSRVFFPFPKISEQNDISRRLDAAAKEIRSLQEHAEKLRAQKLGLMHDLLTGKVPVKVGAGGTAHG